MHNIPLGSLVVMKVRLTGPGFGLCGGPPKHWPITWIEGSARLIVTGHYTQRERKKEIPYYAVCSYPVAVLNEKERYLAAMCPFWSYQQCVCEDELAVLSSAPLTLWQRGVEEFVQENFDFSLEKWLAASFERVMPAPRQIQESNARRKSILKSGDENDT